MQSTRMRVLLCASRWETGSQAADAGSPQRFGCPTPLSLYDECAHRAPFSLFLIYHLVTQDFYHPAHDRKPPLRKLKQARRLRNSRGQWLVKAKALCPSHSVSVGSRWPRVQYGLPPPGIMPAYRQEGQVGTRPQVAEDQAAPPGAWTTLAQN